jgi:hypothetical protein
MLRNASISIPPVLLVLAVALASAVWAAKLEGEYLATGNSFFEKIAFKSGGKVRVTFMGMTKVGTYEIEGDEVLITVGNDTNVFTLDAQGCVAGGGLLGTYCKGGKRQASSSKDTDKEGGAHNVSKIAKLSGVYKAGNSDASIVLDFKTENKVRITVSGAKAKKESHDAKYTVVGDRVTINDPNGGQPLILTRKGNTLEGAPEGEDMKLEFRKK